MSFLEDVAKMENEVTPAWLRARLRKIYRNSPEYLELLRERKEAKKRAVLSPALLSAILNGNPELHAYATEERIDTLESEIGNLPEGFRPIQKGAQGALTDYETVNYHTEFDAPADMSIITYGFLRVGSRIRIQTKGVFLAVLDAGVPLVVYKDPPPSPRQVAA